MKNKTLTISTTKHETIFGWIWLAFQMLALPEVLSWANETMGLSEAELNFCFFVINFIAVYFLLRHTSLGLIAVAGVSSLISIIRNLAITVPYTAKILKLKWYTFYKDVAVSTLCFVISAGVCMLIQKAILPYSWLRMVLSVGVACIISAGLMLLVLLNKQEKQQFASKFLRRFFHG